MTTLAFFVGLESALFVLGVPKQTVSSDPLVGFSKHVPLMESVTSSDGVQRIQTATGKLAWFNPQTFTAKKPPGTKRIICVGGSTTFGRPFDDTTSYSGWLRELLPKIDPSHHWEVINAGGVSYASYRVATVMEELAQYEPDLFIVYSVHNEFLERRTYEGLFETSQLNRDLRALIQNTRTWRLVQSLVDTNQTVEAQPANEILSAEVDEMLNHSIGPEQYHRDDLWQDKVFQHYELNLARMVGVAKRSGAKIAFITPASNLRDCRPFKSEFSSSLEKSIKIQANETLDLAKAALRREDFRSALSSAEEVLSREPRHAHALFLRGRALFGLDRFDEAEESFTRAVNEDICPLRATTRINETVRAVAAKDDCAIIEFHDRLSDLSHQQLGHGCLGGEYFLDHVHPTVDIHQKLALWIIDELQQDKIIQGTPPSDTVITEVAESIESRINLARQCVAFRNLAKVLHWSGKFDEAIPRAQDALDLIPEDLESRFVLADSLVNRGDDQEALNQYRQLFEIGDFPRAYLPFGELLQRLGDLTTAKTYLTLASIIDESHQARAHYSLGIVLLELEEYSEAVKALSISNQLYPNDPSTLMFLDEAERNLRAP